MGEAKRRRQTGQTAPGSKDKKPVIIGVAVLVVALVVALVAFLTAPPAPTSEELPVAAPGAEPYPAERDQYGVSVGQADAPGVVREFAD